MSVFGATRTAAEVVLLLFVLALIFFPAPPSSTLTTRVYMDAVVQGIRIGHNCARRGDSLSACELQVRAYERR